MSMSAEAKGVAKLVAELQRQRARAEKLEKALRELLTYACGTGVDCMIAAHNEARAALAPEGT